MGKNEGHGAGGETVRTFRVVDCEQRSEAWFAARLGRLTGSVAADMLSEVQKGEAAKRRNLRLQLVLERLTGKPPSDGFVSSAMQQGIERESAAAAAYEALSGRIVTHTGFLQHVDLMAGVSLDGHVGDFEGICEIKCPEPSAHLAAIRTGRIPDSYEKQCLHALWISGAEWCDWLTFNPDFPDGLQVKLIRMNRNDSAIQWYADKAIAFLAEVDKEEAELKERAGAAA